MPGNDNRRDAFRAWVSDHGPSVSDVAKKAGIPPTTLYSYLAGKSQSLKGSTQERIAAAYSVPVDNLFGGASSVRRDVGVWGKIGARADVYPLSDFTHDPMYEVELPPTLNADEDYVAFEIDGFSMPPAEPGWLVVFRNVEVTPDDLINSACLVDTADGRRLFKRLRQGYEPGRFNLESWDGTPLIENVDVLRVMPFAALTPGRRGR